MAGLGHLFLRLLQVVSILHACDSLTVVFLFLCGRGAFRSIELLLVVRVQFLHALLELIFKLVVSELSEALFVPHGLNF